jgi:hypothetical protein
VFLSIHWFSFFGLRRFEFKRVDEESILTVAMGPLEEAIPSYQRDAWGSAQQPGPSSSLSRCTEDILFPLQSLQHKSTAELLATAFP